MKYLKYLPFSTMLFVGLLFLTPLLHGQTDPNDILTGTGASILADATGAATTIDPNNPPSAGAVAANAVGNSTIPAPLQAGVISSATSPTDPAVAGSPLAAAAYAAAYVAAYDQAYASTLALYPNDPARAEAEAAILAAAAANQGAAAAIAAANAAEVASKICAAVTCPPCMKPDPDDNCECKRANTEECHPYVCDDGDPCTANDVVYMDCFDNICIPCQGEQRRITTVNIINVEDCGAIPCGDGQFKGDIEINFNYGPVFEEFIITGDIYFSYKEEYCEVRENSIIVKDRCFEGDGEKIKLNILFNDKLACSNKRVVAGVALSCGSGNRLGLFNSSTSNSNELALALNPNPASKELSIDLGAGYSGSANVEIFDLSGKSHSFTTLDYNHTALPLDISQLSNGIYMVRVTAGGAIMTKRLVKSSHK